MPIDIWASGAFCQSSSEELLHQILIDVLILFLPVVTDSHSHGLRGDGKLDVRQRHAFFRHCQMCLIFSYGREVAVITEDGDFTAEAEIVFPEISVHILLDPMMDAVLEEAQGLDRKSVV